MTPDQQPPIEQKVAALEAENQQLRAQLERIEKRAEVAREGRKRALRFTWRVLIPLLDRKKVVRNFSKLAQTTSEFVGPPEQWPTKERFLKDASDFMSACIRFVIRRRMFFLLFTIIATSIPFIQVYLVVQQNELIDKTNELFEVQINDMIARSMTDVEDPNTRRMAVALLANAKVGLLKGVVTEIFDPEVAGINFRVRAEDARVRKKQLVEAGFRAHLMRAVGRSVHKRSDSDGLYDIYYAAWPMFDAILRDTTMRLPAILRMTSSDVRSAGIKKQVLEEADFYIYHVGFVLRQYGRLARAAGEKRQFYRDLKPLMQSLAALSDLSDSDFRQVYRVAMEEFFFDLAEGAKLGSRPVAVGADKDPDAVKKAGFERLKKGIGDDALDWSRFARQLGVNG